VSFTLRVVLAAVAVAAMALPKPPVVDEESYLWLGRTVGWADPYAWTRSWQGGDGFLYAHPPLHLWWMKLISPLGLGGRLPALGWVALYAWAAATWMARACKHPGYAAAAWLASSTVLLGLQDSLMIDLPMVALATAGLAAYREALSRDNAGGIYAVAGLALGAAIETKYPAVLVAGVVAIHAFRIRLSPRHAAALFLPLIALPAAIEGAIYVQHGAFHPLVAWESRDIIASGPLEGRALGTLARLALLPTCLGLALAAPVHLVAGTALGLAALLWVRPGGLDASGALALLVFAALGGTALSRAALACVSPVTRRRKGDRLDSFMLGSVVIAVVLGVVGVHNYASARYLLPAAVPVAILAARSAEEVAHGKRALAVATGLAGALGLATVAADWAYARASAEVATGMIEQHRASLFRGEWTFRHAMEAAGASRVDEPTPGTLVAVDEQSGGAVPAAWEPMARVVSTSRFPLRVVDVRAGAGLYAETLGPLPVALGHGPLAAATLYEVR